MKNLKDLFLDELADMYDAEQRIAKALPKLAQAATDPDLRDAFETHLEETEGHISMVTEVFAAFDEPVRAKTCEATVGLLKEADEIAEEFKGSPAINAALISAAQKVEHYEIASYGCLYEWAELLDNTDAADLLEDILNEEKEADEKLTEIARSASNEEAEAEDSEEEDDDEAIADAAAERGGAISQDDVPEKSLKGETGESTGSKLGTPENEADEKELKRRPFSSGKESRA